MDIIEGIKNSRLQRKLKQSELGEKLGLPQSHISKIESGLTDPRLSTLVDIARILDQELVLVPRELRSYIDSLVSGKTQERRWEPDEDENEEKDRDADENDRKEI